MGRIQAHEIHDFCMVYELSDTSLKNFWVTGIQEGELIWMHGDTDIMGGDKVTNLSEGVLKLGLPRIRTDRMGGKGDKIGGYSEEEDAMKEIELENGLETGKVILDGCTETIL